MVEWRALSYARQYSQWSALAPPYRGHCLKSTYKSPTTGFTTQRPNRSGRSVSTACLCPRFPMQPISKPLLQFYSQCPQSLTAAFDAQTNQPLQNSFQPLRRRNGLVMLAPENHPRECICATALSNRTTKAERESHPPKFLSR